MSNTITQASSPFAPAPTPAAPIAAAGSAEMELGLWLFLSAPISFVVTLLIIVYGSSVSF